MQKYATHKLFYIAKDGDDDDVCGEEKRKRRESELIFFVYFHYLPSFIFLSLLTIRFLFMALVTHMTAAICSLMNELRRGKWNEWMCLDYISCINLIFFLQNHEVLRCDKNTFNKIFQNFNKLVYSLKTSFKQNLFHQKRLVIYRHCCVIKFA